MNHIDKLISQVGIVPIVTMLHNPEKDAAPLANALCKGGLPIAEVTLRFPGAETAIRLMKEACPDMIVGAGTVLTTAHADRALAAGAEFVVCPGFDAELVAYCLDKGLHIYPGCTTATEYLAAMKFGLEVLKFFPVEPSGGLEQIRLLSEPFPMFKVMTTGGITLENLGYYLSSPAVCAGGSDYMVKADLIDAQDWDTIIDLCQKSLAVTRAAKGM